MTRRRRWAKPRRMSELKAAQQKKEAESLAEEPTSFVGTLGWVGAVVACAFFALLLLTWLGPLGDR